jgi:Aldolase/RraA
MPGARKGVARVAPTVIANVAALPVLPLMTEGLQPLAPLTPAHVAARRGVVGAIVGGAVRDVRTLHAPGLPVWRRSVRPLAYTRRLGCVGRDVPATCWGVRVAPAGPLTATTGAAWRQLNTGRWFGGDDGRVVAWGVEAGAREHARPEPAPHKLRGRCEATIAVLRAPLCLGWAMGRPARRRRRAGRPTAAVAWAAVGPVSRRPPAHVPREKRPCRHDTPIRRGNLARAQGQLCLSVYWRVIFTRPDTGELPAGLACAHASSS